MGPSKTATKAERAHMARIADMGCIACRKDGNFRPAAVHHIVQGQRRMGHMYVLPLCDPGHHQNGAQFGMVSVHPYKARFEAMYGTQMDLLKAIEE